MRAKRYFQNEFQVEMFNLEYHNASDFYIGCWQNNRSCVPLLLLRGILCGGNIAIVVASMVLLYGPLTGHGFWWIYLTHWGIVANALTTLFAFGISFRVYLKGPLDGSFGLPWYVKVYWFLYNASVPMALLITIFYWSFISGLEFAAAIDVTLDVFIHAVNSVVMLTLMVTARHPSRLLHFYHVIAFGLLYLLFNLIYYYAGGLDSNGNAWIYPMIDWSRPLLTSLVVLATVIGLLLLHGLVVVIALTRNYYSRRYRKEDRSFSISG